MAETHTQRKAIKQCLDVDRNLADCTADYHTGRIMLRIAIRMAVDLVRHFENLLDAKLPLSLFRLSHLESMLRRYIGYGCPYGNHTFGRAKIFSHNFVTLGYCASLAFSDARSMVVYWLIFAMILSPKKLTFRLTGELQCHCFTLSRSCPSVRFSNSVISSFVRSQACAFPIASTKPNWKLTASLASFRIPGRITSSFPRSDHCS